MYTTAKYNNAQSIVEISNTVKRNILDPINIRCFSYPAELASVEGVFNWDQHIKSIESNCDNKKILKEIASCHGVYAIHTRKQGTTKWSIKYIGQTGGVGSRQRIRNHLITKHKQTGSKLELVKSAVSSGKEIGISFVEVDPFFLRHAVEEILIAQCGKQLLWNNRGKQSIKELQELFKIK